jgi:hypothetical protein
VIITEESPHVSLSASVNVVTYNNVVSLFKSVQDGCSGTASTGESDGAATILNGSEALLKGVSGGVSSSRIVKFTVWNSDIFLGVCGSKMNGDVDASVNGFRLLTSMDGESGETRVTKWEVVTF